MRVNEDAICKVCKVVFCCSKCRQKHEIKTHAIIIKKSSVMSNNNNNNNNDNIPSNNMKNSEQQNSFDIYKKQRGNISYVMCPICENRPFVFHSVMYDELVQHIAKEHLPLFCQKCCSVYETLDDLKNFSKCINTDTCNVSKVSSSVGTDHTCVSDSSKVTLTKGSAKKHTSISTQTSPMPKGLHDSHLTPISIINMRWKAKSKIQEESISDVSSLKNVSSINCSMRRSIGTELSGKAKLIRSTSTPVQLSLTMLKPCEQVFNGSSGGHVSSIFSSSCDSDTSPALPANSAGTPLNALDTFNRYRKVGGRPKLSAVTPLRQVMSKSIQKAFAEHGGLPKKETFQPRINMFDSANTSAETSGQLVPLDLRSSPVIRRTQSVSDDSASCLVKENEKFAKPSNNANSKHKEYLLSTHKQTTESIIITRTEHLSATKEASNSSNDPYASKKTTDTSGNQQMHSSSGNGSTGSSVFKSCHSVEIVTSTEVSFLQEELHQAVIESDDVLEDLPSISVKNLHNAIARTPNTRQSLQIQKKVIIFETPNRENDSIEHRQRSSPGEMFFTPESTAGDKSPESSPPSEKRKQLAARNLNQKFSPFSRRSLRNCAQSTAFSRIEDCSDTFEDDVFLPERQSSKEESPEQNKRNEKTSDKNGYNNADYTSVGNTSRLWSLMSSVMRLPSKKKTLQEHKDIGNETDYNSNSLIKRCASIAGSLVRSKSLVDDEVQSLKRKRTYTTDQSTYLSNLNHREYTSPTLASSKRLRIQGRKPIERMRKVS